MSITTSTGTTVSIETRTIMAGRLETVSKVIILDNPAAPGDARNVEAGRVVYNGQGFQPNPFSPGAMRPEVLRAIADLIEQED